MAWNDAFDGDDSTFGTVSRTALEEWLGRDNGSILTITGWRFLQDGGPTRSSTSIRIWATDDPDLWTDACEAPDNGIGFDFGAAGWSEIEDLTVGDGDFSGTFATPFDAQYVVAYSLVDTDGEWWVHEFDLTSGSDEFCGAGCDHPHHASDVILDDGQTVQEAFDAGGGVHTHDEYVPRSAGTEDLDLVADAGPAIELDALAGNVKDVTLTEDCALSISALLEPVGSFTLLLRPAGFDVTWDGAITWPGGSAPTLSDALHIITFLSVSTGAGWYGKA